MVCCVVRDPAGAPAVSGVLEQIARASSPRVTPCGDEAVLFDASHPITDLARDLGTIPYEVLTSIPPRVKRVHVRG